MEIHGSINGFAEAQQPDRAQQKQTSINQNQYSPEDKEKIANLKQRDQEVRRHEQAHKNAGSGLTGNPIYEFETGPDGRQYAVEGSVEIDTSKEVDPEKTIKKAEKIQAAALAPADPSTADKAAASKARQMEQEAQREIIENEQKENKLYNQSGNDDTLPTPKSTISLIV